MEESRVDARLGARRGRRGRITRAQEAAEKSCRAAGRRKQKGCPSVRPSVGRSVGRSVELVGEGGLAGVRGVAGFEGPAGAGLVVVGGLDEVVFGDLFAAQEAGGADAEDDGAGRGHGGLGGGADDVVGDGEVVLCVDVEESSDLLEEGELAALGGVDLGLAEGLHDGVDGLVRGDLGGEVVLPAEGDGAVDDGGVAAAEGDGDAGGDDAADGDGLAVGEAAEGAGAVGDGLDGVGELVAVDEDDGLPLLLGVDVDDLALELDGAAGDLLEKVRVGDGSLVLVEGLEEDLGVLAEGVLDDLAEAVGEEPVLEGLEDVGIDDDLERRVVAPDEVLAVWRVDRLLVGDGGVDLGEEGGREVDEADAAVEGRGDEAAEVGDRAAAERDEDRVLVYPDREDLVGELGEHLEGLGVLAVGDDDLVDAVPEFGEALDEALAVQRVDRLVGEHEMRRRGRHARDDLERGLLGLRDDTARHEDVRPHGRARRELVRRRRDVALPGLPEDVLHRGLHARRPRREPRLDLHPQALPRRALDLVQQIVGRRERRANRLEIPRRVQQLPHLLLRLRQSLVRLRQLAVQERLRVLPHVQLRHLALGAVDRPKPIRGVVHPERLERPSLFLVGHSNERQRRAQRLTAS
mmetsp:Transcript_7970/g.24508  ORF Transcript_7970/g.24508 Transcript_7970/m.24508 type:complete len:634 (+) Transcript_7970:255-2156(+)